MKHTHCYMIDLDGTIYHRANILPYAKEWIAALQTTETPFLFFTNSPELSRKSLCKKLNVMGLCVDTNQILTAGDVAIRFIQKDSSSNTPTAYIVGSEEFKNDCKKANIKVLDNCEEVADYVVVGYDPSLTLKDFEQACTHIFQGAIFLSTNQDETIPTSNGLIPHTGAIVSFIAYATGKQALNLGKPEKATLAAVLEQLQCQPEDLCLVGDNLQTDILMAEKFQLSSYLLLTGLTSKKWQNLPNFLPESPF